MQNALNQKLIANENYVKLLDSAIAAATADLNASPDKKASTQKILEQELAKLSAPAEAAKTANMNVAAENINWEGSIQSLKDQIAATQAMEDTTKTAITDANATKLASSSYTAILDSKNQKLSEALKSLNDQITNTSKALEDAKKAEADRTATAIQDIASKVAELAKQYEEEQKKADDYSKDIDQRELKSNEIEAIAKQAVIDAETQISINLAAKNEGEKSKGTCQASISSLEEQLKTLTSSKPTIEEQQIRAKENYEEALKAKKQADTDYSMKSNDLATANSDLTISNSHVSEQKAIISNLEILYKAQELIMNIYTIREKAVAAQELLRLKNSLEEAEKTLLTHQATQSQNNIKISTIQKELLTLNNIIKKSVAAVTVAEESSKSLEAALVKIDSTIKSINNELTAASDCVSKSEALIAKAEDLHYKLRDKIAGYTDVINTSNAVELAAQELKDAKTDAARKSAQVALTNAETAMSTAYTKAKDLEAKLKEMTGLVDTARTELAAALGVQSTASTQTVAEVASTNSQIATGASNVANSQIVNEDLRKLLSELKLISADGQKALVDDTSKYVKLSAEFDAISSQEIENIKNLAQTYQTNADTTRGSERQNTEKNIEGAHIDLHEPGTPEDIIAIAKDGARYAAYQKKLLLEDTTDHTLALNKVLAVNKQILSPKPVVLGLIAQIKGLDILSDSFIPRSSYLLKEDLRLVDATAAVNDASIIDSPCSATLGEKAKAALAAAEEAKSKLKNIMEMEMTAATLSLLAIRYNIEYNIRMDTQVANRQNIVIAYEKLIAANQAGAAKAQQLSDKFNAVASATTEAARTDAIAKEAAAKVEYDTAINAINNAKFAVESAVLAESSTDASKVARAKAKASTYASMALAAYNRAKDERPSVDNLIYKSSQASDDLEQEQKTCHRRRILQAASSKIL